MWKKSIFFFVFFVFFTSLVIFFAKYNCNFKPEKERYIYTIELYYNSGYKTIKCFELPKDTKFGIISNTSKYKSITYLNWNKHKSFSNEYGTIAFNIDDYKILKIQKLK